MNRERVSQGALKYFLFVAFATSVCFGAMVFGDRPEHRRADVGGDSAPVRSLSQIDEKSRPFIADVKCWDALGKIEVPAGKRFVRLTGKFCKSPARDVDGLEVTNVTNAFVATIFSTGALLTTDLIPLHDGSNDLVVKLPAGRDVKVAHIEITR